MSQSRALPHPAQTHGVGGDKVGEDVGPMDCRTELNEMQLVDRSLGKFQYPIYF